MNNVCWFAEATEKSRSYCIYTDLYALVVMPWVCLLRILGLPMSDSVWNCGRSLVLWVPGISGSIGNGILGEYFPEREYNLLNPKRTRKRPKFQPWSRRSLRKLLFTSGPKLLTSGQILWHYAERAFHELSFICFGFILAIMGIALDRSKWRSVISPKIVIIF